MDENNFNAIVTRRGFWFQVEVTLRAAYAPFLQMADQNCLTELTPPPKIHDFRVDFVSYCSSDAMARGIKTEFQLCPPDKAHITFIESPDFTLSVLTHSALKSALSHNRGAVEDGTLCGTEV